nr:hypothetical protein [Tanacetum cinerariifolium]
TPTEIPILRQYSRRATWIAQSKALPTSTDEPASLLRDDSQGEAFPIVSGLEAEQDRENIIKTSALPHDSTPRVTSLDADEGTVSVPPVAGVSTVGVPTVSELLLTVSAIFTTTSMVTPYSRRPRDILAKDKGKEKVFWSTARIKTTNEGTKILATVDGKPKTIFESSIMRNLKLNDEEGISSLPDAELFENLALMGYNNLPNQRFTFQKGLFSHQWKFLIHKIMQCLSPKSTGFNEFSSNIATAVSKALSPAADEPASLLRDDSQGEAFPTVSSLDAGQDRENINKTSALPHESTSRVTSLNANEGSMQQKLQELMELCIGLQRQQTKMDSKIKAQDLEISSLQVRIKLLEDKDRGSAEPSGDDALIKGRSIEIKEEVEVKRSTELGSNDTEEMVNVLTSMEAANILTSRVAAVSVPLVVGVSTVGVPTFTTASVVTSYSRRPRGILAKDKGKEKVVESEEPKKKKLQEQIDAQVAREIEEEIAREDQRMNEQLARDDEIAIIHAEEELKMLIDGLDMSNEVIAKHLQEYEQSEAELTIGEKIELINELKEQREFYMSVLRSHAGWKTKHFRGMTLEEIKEKFIPVWKQIKDFVPMSSKEEAERVKRKGLRLEQGSAKRMKTSEDVSKEDLKGMMQLVPMEEVYVKALQVKHPTIDWEIHSEGKKDY